MSMIGNMLWIILGGGIFLFLEYVLGGLALCLTVVGIPFGIQCFKLAVLSLTPFGRRVVDRPSATGLLAIIMNLVWIFTGGLPVVFTHLVFGLLCAITIVGLPFARQHFKLAGLALTPFGREIL